MKKTLLIAFFIFPLLSAAAWSQEGPSLHQNDRLLQHTTGSSLPEDMIAVTSAQVEAIKKGLLLTPDQEKLWNPVEGALKAISFRRQETLRNKATRAAVSNDFVEHMQHTATFLTEKAQDFSLLARTLQPFSLALDEKQKRRLCLLVNPFLGKRDWKCLQNVKKNHVVKNKVSKKGEEKQALNTALR